MSDLVSSLRGGWQCLAAVCVTTAVLSVDFVALQRCSVRGIVGGSVKG